MKRYAIWDKQTDIITPIYEVLTPDQWKARYPAAALPNITVVCSAGEVNGGFFGTLGEMRQRCEGYGVDFSGCATDEEALEVIEAFEDAMNAVDPDEVSAEERIAAALEAQTMMAMADAETV